MDPDADLSPRDRAVGLALRRLLEENLYWVLLHDRWLVDENRARTQGVVLGAIPGPVRPLAAAMVRQSVKRQLSAHGIGRHGREEIHAIGLRDLGAVADLLGDAPFLLGDAPTGIDAVAYGMLANILHVPIESPVRDAGLERRNLVDHLDRMRKRCFG